MTKINRAKLRGKPLEKNCKKARLSTHECGIKDNRIFCYGLIDGATEELIEECRDCKANVIFAERLEVSDD